jgi:elongation factor G
VWEAAGDLNLPRLVVLNRLDRERASLDRSLQSLREACSRAVIPVQLPIGEEKSFKGVVDLVTKKAYTFESNETGNSAKDPFRRRWPPPSTPHAKRSSKWWPKSTRS